MNKRDKELADQVRWSVDLTYTDLQEFADLIRADEREVLLNALDSGSLLFTAEQLDELLNKIRADERKALEKIDWTALMREKCLVTWADAQELGDRVLAAIRARGNT